MTERHKILQRQIQRYLGNSDLSAPEMQDFLKAVSESYTHFDRDRDLLERSMELGFQEIEDVNERLRHEAEMRLQAEHRLQEQNEQLTKTNQELDRFVYSASHDLRAPLVSVRGLIDIIRQEQDPAMQQYYLGLAEKSMLKLDRFIQEIIDYSRNSRQEVRVEQVNVRELIESIFEELRFSEEYERVEKRLHISGDGLLWTDPGRLHIVLSNLIGNAIRYSDPRREDSFVEVRVSCLGERSEITVQDNGIGIPEEYQPRIFEMFYRATNVKTGSGLGLFIVREILSKLQGDISLVSAPGAGTTFTLHLPCLHHELAQAGNQSVSAP